jgi:hypothetical protein
MKAVDQPGLAQGALAGFPESARGIPASPHCGLFLGKSANSVRILWIDGWRYFQRGHAIGDHRIHQDHADGLVTSQRAALLGDELVECGQDFRVELDAEVSRVVVMVLSPARAADSTSSR